MPGIEDALQLAVQAHAGQRDKYGAPYILHPLRMMLRMRDEASMIVAVLHDLVEDTPVTLEDLRVAGYSPELLTAVDCLTRREDESYEQFIARIKPNPLARSVKLADLEDNMDLRRIRNPAQKDFERLVRYRRAWEELQAEQERLSD